MLLTLLSSACATQRYSSLPEKPRVPHDFFSLDHQKLFPRAELVWLDQTSHFIQVDRPKETVREIFRFAE